MRIVNTASELQESLDQVRAAGRTIGFVPTMGALHEGHLSLIELAKQAADVIVVSIFVNPLQFGTGEDFDEYPRTLDSDSKALEYANVDLLFAPNVREIYPNGQEITQRAGVVGSTFEGASRPGHFDGMLTVVNRLMELVEPNAVVFGEKDAQQVFMVRKLIGARWPNCRFIEGPTKREADGMAMSSRNRFLSEEDRALSAGIYKNLQEFASELEHGQPVSEALPKYRTNLESLGTAKLDYLAVIDPQIFRPVDNSFTGTAKIIVAIRMGEVRLIDNLNVNIRSGQE